MITIDEFARFNKLKFKQETLLVQALTHRSYLNEHDEPGMTDNERLEFLGDAVVGFITGEWLFGKFPDMDEGDLTRLRSALVQRDSLAAMARDAHLGEAIRVGKGEEANGARDRDNILCDGFEAVVGALFLDQGLAKTKKFVISRLEKRLIAVLSDQSDKDARSMLQEWSQATHNLTPHYRIVASSGPDHDKDFTVEVTIAGKLVGRGTGKSKQAASQAAARDALAFVEHGFSPTG